MIRTSIRLRLLLWIGLLVVLMLGGFGVTAYELTRRSRLEPIDAGLAQRVGALAQEMRVRPGGVGPREPGQVPLIRRPAESVDRREPFRGGFLGGPNLGSSPGIPADRSGSNPLAEMLPRLPGRREIQLTTQTAAMFDESDPAGYFFAVWAGFGTELKRSTNAPADVERPVSGGAQAGIKYQTVGDRRLAYYFTERRECVLVGVSLAEYRRDMHRFLWWLFAAGGLVLVVGAGGGWLIVARALRPVSEIGLAARRIAAGNLQERITPSDPDSELGRLAGVLNSTFARLEAVFAEQRQFTADASHELRTPLTVIISEAQAALTRPRNEAEYRETIETCLEAAQDLRRLAEQLLDLARLDAGQGLDRRQALDLAAITETCVALVRPLAEAREIGIELKLAPTPLTADPGRMRQVLVNLLDNAIHYNRERGAIRVETYRDDQGAVLVVADTGAGIAPEDLPHVFGRFFRADKARSGGEGRAGLGLAIVQAIVEAHHGKINVTSVLGEGTTFTLRFPA